MTTHKKASSRRRSFTPLLLASGVLGSLILGGTATVTLGAFTASITNKTNTASTGTLVISLSDGTNTCASGQGPGNSYACPSIAVYGASMRPNTTTTTTMTITNTGTLTPSTLAASVGNCASSGGVDSSPGNLCAAGTLTITASGGGAAIYSGPPADAVGTLMLTPPAPGQSIGYVIKFSTPATTSSTYNLEGVTLTQPYSFTASS